MLLFYIDESGTGLGDERTPFFTLAALAIAIEQWSVMDLEVAALKRRLVSWAKPEDFEIKGREIRRGEKFFKGQNWSTRAQAMREVARLIADLPCQVLTVQVDKRDLPDYIGSDSDLYRLAFWRLLEEIEATLKRTEEPGMLMLDMRSDMHSSVQDRRLLDAYREWIASRLGHTHLVELPWFGFSAFYAGLQLADFAAYITDFAANESVGSRDREEVLVEIFETIRSKTRCIHIP